MVTSMVAAFIPARNAARVDPVQALQKGKYQQLSAGENRARQDRGAGGRDGCALACLLFERYRIFFYVGDALAVLAALLLTPTLALWLARALRPLLQWLRPVEGALAADSLIQAPRRTSGAVAALMLSLALVVALGGMARASYDSIFDWITGRSIRICSSRRRRVSRARLSFPESMGAQLRADPGHRRSADWCAMRASSSAARRSCSSRPMSGSCASAPRCRRWPAIPTRCIRLAAQARRCWRRTTSRCCADSSWATWWIFPRPSGMLRLPIAGIVTDYSDQQGSILMDRALYKRYWNDDTVNVFRIYLAPGAVGSGCEAPDSGALRQPAPAVRADQSRSAQLHSATDRSVVRHHLRADRGRGAGGDSRHRQHSDRSITDRRRELGVLQAVGGLRNQIRGTIWLEALAVGTVGLMLGLALGALQLYYSLQISAEDIAGLRLSYEYPYSIALLLVPVILLVAFVSAIAPAESAVRGSLVEALEYE